MMAYSNNESLLLVTDCIKIHIKRAIISGCDQLTSEISNGK